MLTLLMMSKYKDWIEFDEQGFSHNLTCLLYTSDAADDLLCVDLGGRRIIKKKIQHYNQKSHHIQLHN